jgi:heterodisulfide reductase subunit D
MDLNIKLKETFGSIANCDKCGVCTFVTKEDIPISVCPMYEYDKSFVFSPNGLMYTARAIVQGNEEYDQSVADFVFSCADCGACDAKCVPVAYPKPHLHPTEITKIMRRDVIEKGIIPKGPMESIAKAVQKDGDLLGKDTPKIPAAVLNDQADTVLFADCFHSPAQAAIYESAGKLLQKIGKQVALFADGGCCGSSLYDLGFWKELKKLMEAKAAKIKEKKGKSFLFINPHCQEFVVKEYPKMVPGFEAVQSQHFSELLAEALKNGSLKSIKKNKVTVAYLDPCALGRGLKIYDAPRNALAAMPGVELTEMMGVKDAAFCCGSRALGKYHPEFSKATAKKGMERFKATGADILITACPYCKQAMQGVLPDNEKTIVKDLIEFVDERTS